MNQLGRTTLLRSVMDARDGDKVVLDIEADHLALTIDTERTG